MRNVKQIVCVVDPTTEQQPALERAVWLARNTDAALELFICYYNEYLSGEQILEASSLEITREEIISGQEKHLQDLAAPLADSGMDVTTTAVWDHPLHEGIVRHAATVGADIVFKDTHHHSAVARAVLTHSDWNLIRACPCPVWLVKPQSFSDTPVYLAAIDPMNEHDKPAALDDEIIVIARMLANATGGSLHTFHAYDPRIAVASASANAYLPVSLPIDEIEQQMRERHGRRFTEITTFHDIAKDNAHLVCGLTHEELPALAGEIDADVVVMGAVSRNRWKRLFIGATAERTLEHLPCDLLIVKPDWFQQPADIATARTG